MALGTLSPACAQADALAIDQQQTVTKDAMQYGDQGPIAQTFTPTQDNVAGLGVFVTGEGQGSGRPNLMTIMTLSLWSGLPQTDGSQLLAYGTVVGTWDQIAKGGYYDGQGWVDVFFDPVAVTPGQTYYLFADSTNPRVEYEGSKGDVYAGGQPYFFGMTPAGQGGTLVSDAAFREYYLDPPAFTGGAAREPAAWALMVGGFGLAGAALRRRRARRETVAAIS